MSDQKPRYEFTCPDHKKSGHIDCEFLGHADNQDAYWCASMNKYRLVHEGYVQSCGEDYLEPFIRARAMKRYRYNSENPASPMSGLWGRR